MAITFDTMKFVETLEDAGVDRKQASAIVAVMRDAHDASDVATKGDISLLRKDIDLVRSDMRGERILTRWMLGVLTAGVGTILVKLFWG